jgi:ATP-dependent RNA helicase RhlE
MFAAKATPSTSPARHPIRALILVPTRELAAQVQDSVRTYGKRLKLRLTVNFGGAGFKPQADELRQVEILVLDEADRMLDMGFIPAIRRVLALLPAKRRACSSRRRSPTRSASSPLRSCTTR